MSKKKDLPKGQAVVNTEEPPPLPSEYTKPPDMPFFIPNDEEQGVHRFILAAARRARQLQGGARPTISTSSRKPTKIAIEEIRSGSIAVELLPDDWVEPEIVLPEPLEAEATDRKPPSV